MSFLGDIQGFSKSKLRKTSTEVTTVGGRRIRETRDDHGRTSTQIVAEGELGFVGDYKPDLQVAQVLPGLCFGKYYMATSSGK